MTLTNLPSVIFQLLKLSPKHWRVLATVCKKLRVGAEQLSGEIFMPLNFRACKGEFPPEPQIPIIYYPYISPLVHRRGAVFFNPEDLRWDSPMVPEFWAQLVTWGTEIAVAGRCSNFGLCKLTYNSTTKIIRCNAHAEFWVQG